MRKTTTLLTIGGLSLALAACTETDETAGPTSETTTESSTPEPTTMVAEDENMADAGEAVESRVGGEAGMDCAARGDCSVLFTVEAMDVLDACEGSTFGESPVDTQLVKATVLIKTKPSDYSYDPGTFPIWTDWSASTPDGVNQPLPASTWCSNADGETPWMEPIRVGDTVRHVHLMDVPVEATEIRLTETTVGSRWTFPAP